MQCLQSNSPFGIKTHYSQFDILFEQLSHLFSSFINEDRTLQEIEHIPYSFKKYPGNVQ